MSVAYRDYDSSKTETANFSDLVGKTLTSVTNNADDVVFVTDSGETYRQVYYDDCCAHCSVEEIHGDLADLVGSPILMAEESSSSEPDEIIAAERSKEKAEAEARDGYYYSPESETWTFYKIATIKGSVTIRWYGSSNGYYSETATFEKVRC